MSPYLGMGLIWFDVYSINKNSIEFTTIHREIYIVQFADEYINKNRIGVNDWGVKNEFYKHFIDLAFYKAIAKGWGHVVCICYLRAFFVLKITISILQVQSSMYSLNSTNNQRWWRTEKENAPSSFFFIYRSSRTPTINAIYKTMTVHGE